jgi:hypothetical protein
MRVLTQRGELANANLKASAGASACGLFHERVYCVLLLNA